MNLYEHQKKNKQLTIIEQFLKIGLLRNVGIIVVFILSIKSIKMILSKSLSWLYCSLRNYGNRCDSARVQFVSQLSKSVI